MVNNSGYPGNPWNVGQNARSATPVPPPQAPPPANLPPPPQNAASATNQATMGMGALNLGPLMNPAVFAAQVALLNSLTGGSDLATLISNLQTTTQLGNSASAAPGGHLAPGGWWPSTNTSSASNQAVPQGSDLMNSGGGGGGGSRSQNWTQNEDWR